MSEIQSRYATVRQFAQEQSVFTEGSLRMLIFDERKNGLKKHGVITRVGRKILIDKAKFSEWVASKNSSKTGA
ncbi:MAG: hypothetical protein KGZ88_18985 [Methylomicrobium sp.]|nr:hypothetical protein [Methylomicrobium sp.]